MRACLVLTNHCKQQRSHFHAQIVLTAPACILPTQTIGICRNTPDAFILKVGVPEAASGFAQRWQINA